MAGDSQHKRLEAAVELMLKIGAGDLAAQGEVSDACDHVDAIVMGLNMLAQDLLAETKARQHAEELLHDERDAYENAPGLFCSIDPSDLNILKCNQTLAKALGKSKEQILGSSLLSLCPDDSHPALYEVISQLHRGETRATCEVRMIEGDEFLIASLSATQVDDPRRGKRVRMIFQDITERRIAENLLGTTKQKLETLFTASPDYLVLLDSEHKITMANKMFPGVQTEAILGMPVIDFVSPERRHDIEKILNAVVERAERQQWNARYSMPDGAVVDFDTVATPIIEDGKVTGTVLAARDTTEQVRLQYEKDHLLEQMRQAQKMEAVGQLAGGVAHDFNNILTAIMGYTSLAQLECHKGHPMRTWADEVSKASSRAADLTKQLLAFSRRQVTEPKVINMSELVQNLVPMLSRLIGETIQLRTIPESLLPGVLVDPGQAEQLVANLVINARDAMPEGGEILIETTRTILDEEHGRTHAPAAPGEYVLLAVSDTGCGMSPEVRDRAFEPFFTTKETGNGTGLGLSTVFGIVEQSGGGLEVYSEVGIGSSFKIYFPCTSDTIESLASTPATHVPAGGKETLLVVEDEQMVRELATGLLRRLGYTVLVAADGDEALELCDEYDGEIHALVTDVVMPGLNGRDLAKLVSDVRPELRVLFTSGYPRDIITNQGVLDAGVHFLPKPYSLESLARQVRDLLDG